MHIYHYTTEFAIGSILSDGFIKEASGSIGPREIPAVWFTRHPMWEPTANKGIMTPDGVHRGVLTTAEMFAMIRLYRFKIPLKALPKPLKALPWAQLKRKARISGKEQRRLISAAKSVNSDHTLWYGVLNPVPVSIMTIEVWDGEQWLECDPADQKTP